MISLSGIQQATALLNARGTINTENLASIAGNCDLNQLREIASLQDSNSLSRADLWNALARADELNLDAATRQALMDAFHYRASDTNFENVSLKFNSVAFSNGQVASVEITPNTFDEDSVPIVFVGGLQHPTRVYYETMRNLAIQTHRKVILVDCLGMGGSENNARSVVYPNDLRNSVAAVIQNLKQRNLLPLVNGIPQVSIMAHSLGTIPARDLYLHPETLRGIHINKLVAICPVPSAEDQSHGYHLNHQFAALFSLKTISDWAEVSPMLSDLFFQNHTDQDRTWVQNIVNQERYSTNLLSTVATFLRAYSTKLLSTVANDPHVSLVFPEEDQLMPMTNREDWRGRGIYQVAAADHSFIATNICNRNTLSILISALQESPTEQQAARVQSIYRHLQSDSYLGYSRLGGLNGLMGRLAQRLGVWNNEYLGIHMSGGLESAAQYGHQQTNSVLGRYLGNGFAELNFESMQLPIQFGIGFFGGIDTFSHSKYLLDAGIRCHLRINFEWLRFEARGSRSLLNKRNEIHWSVQTPSHTFFG